MDSVRSILKRKGSEVWSLTPEATVYEAIAMMADKGVGAIMVVSGGKLVGVISERDYARKVILRGKFSKAVRVRDIMSSPVVTVTPDHTVDECMRTATKARRLFGSPPTRVFECDQLIRHFLPTFSSGLRVFPPRYALCIA